jgi:putative ABC transport system ATP-binding protein
MTEPLLSLRSATKVHDRGGAPVHALAGIDLEVFRGDYVALTGPSGSGKSTLMNLIGCLDRPTTGTCRIAGTDTTTLDPAALAALRRRIGFVFQSFHLLPGLTAVQNVALPLRYANVGPAERERAAVAMLERVGLGARLHHHPRELSGGQQQRVAIARALVTTPDLLLADEPTGNLDSRAGVEIRELLEELWREGRTLMVVTHDDALAARAARIVRLLDGRIVRIDVGAGADAHTAD